MSEPVYGDGYDFHVVLQDMANPGSFKANPTLAAGDFKISINGGAFANLTTLPTVEPAAGVAVLITLSGPETEGGSIIVTAIDQTSPKEWADAAWNFHPQAAALDAAGVRDAIGLASANLDTQLSTIDSEIGTIDGIVDAILLDTAEIGVAGAGLTEAGGTGDHLTALATAANLATVAGYLDTEILAIIADTEDIQSRLPSALVDGRIDATVDGTGMESGAVDNIWDEALEGSYTARQLMRLFTAALGGIVAGAGTTSITFRNTGDSKDVITATVDVNGNRSEVTLDLT